MLEASPAVWAPPWTPTHGAKLLPPAPYEPPHQASKSVACAKATAGMTNVNTANVVTTLVHLMSHPPSVGFTAPALLGSRATFRLYQEEALADPPPAVIPGDAVGAVDHAHQ